MKSQSCQKVKKENDSFDLLTYMTAYCFQTKI